MAKGQALNAADLDRLAHQGGVKPAAAAPAAGDGAEFVAAVAQHLANVVGELGRKRAGTDPGAICLGDAKDRFRRRSGRRPAPLAAVAATVLLLVTKG